MILTCQLMFTLDTSVIVTALPKIRETLHFSSSGLSWVQNAYTLAFGGLLLLGARLGDIFGRRRVFLWGVGVFAAASFLAGVAPTAQILVLGRAVQGVAGAVAAPSTLALLLTTFKEAHPRARAIAMYSSVASGGTAIGLIVGGLLTTTLSWRWGLFINVPIGLAIVIVGPRVLPDTVRHPGRFDVTGAVTSTLGMTVLVYAFVRAAEDGWSNGFAIGAFATGGALMVAFVVTELRAEQPITPLRLFTERARAGAYLARVFINGGMFSFFFYISVYLEGARNYSPLDVGYAFLPLTLVMFTTAQILPRLPAHLSNWALIAGGAGTAFIGMAWLSRLSASTQFWPNIVLPMTMLGVGVGVAFIRLTGVSVAGVAQHDEGAASGLVNVSQTVGASLGLAVMVTVFGAATTHAAAHLPAGVNAARRAQLLLGHGTSAVLTGSAISMGVAVLVILLMVRTRSAPEAVAQPVLAEDEAALETLSPPLLGPPPKVT
ncbi:MAG TPA: MFS transporter [Frankiaceae bacterium]|nr:MFS transporter [Frankiaceae bacterium]